MCGACNVSIRQALKARGNGEPYQLRWLKSKQVCCVLSCSSTDIEVYRHDFSWGDVCNSIGIENVSSPVNCLLCSKHYQQVYRMLNVVSKACVCCNVWLNGDTSIVPHLPYNLLPVLILDELSHISKVP